MPRASSYEGLLATTTDLFKHKYNFNLTGNGAHNMLMIWGHRERAAERNPGKTSNNYAEWKSNYAAAKQADANLDTVLQEYRKEKIKEWNIAHGWPNGVKPAVDLAELEKPTKLRKVEGRARSPVLAEPAPPKQARWSTEAAAALAELVEEQETTLRWIKADEPTWTRIAERLRTEVAGAEYTWRQCRDKAYNLGLLATGDERLPPMRPYFPGVSPPLDLTGLRADIKRGDAARPEFAKLTVTALRWLCGFVFNVGVPKSCLINREALTDALATAGMPACDPNDFGAEVPRVATPAFARALWASVGSHCNVERSVAAAERALGPPDEALPKSGATVISGTTGAGYARLSRKEVLKHYSETYRPEPGDFPPCRANGEVIKNKVTVAYTPHTVFDPRQDCRVCGRLFLDCGGRVFCADRCWAPSTLSGFSRCTRPTGRVTRRRARPPRRRRPARYAPQRRVQAVQHRLDPRVRRARADASRRRGKFGSPQHGRILGRSATCSTHRDRRYIDPVHSSVSTQSHAHPHPEALRRRHSHGAVRVVRGASRVSPRRHYCRVTNVNLNS